MATHVDPHHTVEMLAFAWEGIGGGLGDKAESAAMASRRCRWTKCLVTTAVDLSGRPFFVWQAEVPRKYWHLHRALAEVLARVCSEVVQSACSVITVATHHIIEAFSRYRRACQASRAIRA
jgi:imidazoleglycerol-phosphate dehydratase